MIEDTYKHKGLRRKLVEELRRKGINDEKVLSAIGNVPRHAFMDSSFINFAYKDKAFPIGAGQTISQPYTVAIQTQLLDVKPFEKILEIGTGSGYQAAVLLEMGARVFTIERHKELYLKASAILNELGYRPNTFLGDGSIGLPTYSPFDKILITAATEEIPENLLNQLKIGGLLVAPIGKSDSQIMTVIKKIDEKEFVQSQHGSFIFVPLLRGTNLK